MTSGQPVFVTGGTGVVGGAVLRRLVASGRPVTALARSPQAERALGDVGARPVAGDVLDKASLVAGMRGCEVAYHLAGVNASCLPDPSPLYAVNVSGSRNVVDAAAEAGVRRVVHTSSAATIGEEAGEVGTEDGRHRGWFLSEYERSKFDAERAVLARGEATGIEVVCVNPASVQGPGRSGGTTRLLTSYLTGRLRVVVPSRFSLVDIEDCADGHLRVEERGVAGERYILSGATLDVDEALAVMATITGRAQHPRSIPPAVASGVGALVEASWLLARRKPPVCREVVRTLVHGHAYDGSKAARQLGVRYTPVEDTLRRTAAWLVDEGLVPATAVSPQAAKRSG